MDDGTAAGVAGALADVAFDFMRDKQLEAGEIDAERGEGHDHQWEDTGRMEVAAS